MLAVAHARKCPMQARVPTPTGGESSTNTASSPWCKCGVRDRQRRSWYYTSPMSMGKRTERQPAMWVPTQNLRRGEPSVLPPIESTAARRGVRRLRRGACASFYAEDGPAGLAGSTSGLLLVGYFEGLDSERAIAWRAADSLTLRDFLGLALPGRAAGSFDDLAHAPADRSRDASRPVYLGARATRRGRAGQGQDDCDRCDDARSQRGVAAHRAPRHRRELSGVSDDAGPGVGH